MELLEELAAKGYRLLGVSKIAISNSPTEELLIKILNAPENGRLLEGTAIIINNSPPNYDRLVELAREKGLQNQVGYLLEGSLKVIKKYRHERNTDSLQKAIQELFEIKQPELQFLGHLDMSNSKEILQGITREKEAIKWNVSGGVPYSQLERQFIVYKNDTR